MLSMLIPAKKEEMWNRKYPKISEILNVPCFVTKLAIFNAHKKFLIGISFSNYFISWIYVFRIIINVVCFLHHCSNNEFKNYSNVCVIPYFSSLCFSFLFCLSPLCHGWDSFVRIKRLSCMWKYIGAKRKLINVDQEQILFSEIAGAHYLANNFMYARVKHEASSLRDLQSMQIAILFC